MRKYELPLINVRDLVVFPDLEVPIMVGRKFTIEALEDARDSTRGRVIVLTQKAAQSESPTRLSQMFAVGVIAAVTQSVSFSDGSMKVLIKGRERVHVDRIFRSHGIRYAGGRAFNRTKSAKLSETERRRILEELLRWNPGLAFGGDFTRVKAMLRERDGAKLVHSILSFTTAHTRSFPSKASRKRFSRADMRRLNRDVAQRQRVLEEARPRRQLELLSDVLRAQTLRALQTEG